MVFNQIGAHALIEASHSPSLRSSLTNYVWKKKYMIHESDMHGTHLLLVLNYSFIRDLNISVMNCGSSISNFWLSIKLLEVRFCACHTAHFMSCSYSGDTIWMYMAKTPQLHIKMCLAGISRHAHKICGSIPLWVRHNFKEPYTW